MFGWKNLSIATKLYLVVGIMATLIAGELLTLRFAMRNLSAARAFVGGESLWSKAQKDAVTSLQRYGLSRDELDFAAFLEHLKVPEGDHLARLELQKADPDLSVVRTGFLQGHIHWDDIDPIIHLLRRFYWISYLSRAIDIWTKGDEYLFKLRDEGVAYHQALVINDLSQANSHLAEIKKLDEKLTRLEEDFSYALGEGSRWLENFVLTILTLAVMTVESIGLALTFLTTRALSRGLGEVTQVAQSIGHGHFDRQAPVHSKDEIGKLADAVNQMGLMLRKSYGELEDKVKAAVQSRDEFLSIAAHELKTPLTSLFLRIQMLDQRIRALTGANGLSKIQSMSAASLDVAKRIVALLNELLDLSRIDAGKLELHQESCDLVGVVKEMVNLHAADAAVCGSAITVKAEGGVIADIDAMRVGQAVSNLLSNALKYGAGKPVEVAVGECEGNAFIRVTDHGCGIPLDQQGAIFERFERGATDKAISGLGLGLYITRHIVQAHGGQISVTSVPGQGSTFTIELGGTALAMAA